MSTKEIPPVNGMLVTWRAKEEVPENLRELLNVYVRRYGDHTFVVWGVTKNSTFVGLEKDGKPLCQSEGVTTYFDWQLLKPLLT